MLWKCCTQYASKFGKLSSGHRTGKGQFSFQFQSGNAKECSNYHTIALTSYASKVLFNILQASLQQYMNQNFQIFKAGFRKSRGTRDKIANNHWVIVKQENSRKTSTSALLTMPKPWLWGSLQTAENSSRDEIQDYLTCLLRNLYAGQKATVRTGHGIIDWFQSGKGVHQGCIFSPCLFNSYAEYIIENARLDEAQAGIKIPRRNINNLRYADDTTLMAESKEELKSLLMKVKEESEKAGLQFNIQKTKILASSLNT